MKDLQNERHEVRRRLEAYNFEPVNAEHMLPSGKDSWTAIYDELAESDVFVLVLADEYGWSPDDGPHGGSKKSVTELEFEAALDLDVPVLPFAKQLPLKSCHDDAARDRFRERVQAWNGGKFRAEYELASDLADKVGHSVIEVLLNGYKAHRKRTTAPPRPIVATSTARSVTTEIPRDLFDPEFRAQSLLWVGAGLSINAGLPSAFAFMTSLATEVERVYPDYETPGTASAFNAVTTDYALTFGHENLREAAADLVLDGGSDVHGAHRDAIRLFDRIATTNYDVLLERAMDAENDERSVFADEIALANLPERYLIKAHGSAFDPDSIPLTETEVGALWENRPNLFRTLRRELETRPVIFAGTSLRDPSLVALLESCRGEMKGWFVGQNIRELDARRVARWGLKSVQADLPTLLATVAKGVTPD